MRNSRSDCSFHVSCVRTGLLQFSNGWRKCCVDVASSKSHRERQWKFSRKISHRCSVRQIAVFWKNIRPSTGGWLYNCRKISRRCSNRQIAVFRKIYVRALMVVCNSAEKSVVDARTGKLPLFAKFCVRALVVENFSGELPGETNFHCNFTMGLQDAALHWHRSYPCAIMLWLVKMPAHMNSNTLNRYLIDSVSVLRFGKKLSHACIVQLIVKLRTAH
jgi:hypothetical protein